MEERPDCIKLIAMGICHADCCGPIPFNRSFITKYKDKLQRPVKEWRTLYKIKKRGRNKDTGKVVPINEDMCCPFLTEEYHCAIYDIRPNICKKIGTKALPCRFQNIRIQGHRENILKKEGD